MRFEEVQLVMTHVQVERRTEAKVAKKLSELESNVKNKDGKNRSN